MLRMQAALTVNRNLAFGAPWVGESVDGRFPLQKYLGGSSTSAVFLTHVAGSPDTKAVIKLLPVTSCDPDAQLAMWRTAARLSHPHLIRIFDGGRCWLAGNDLLFVVMEYADENLGEVLPRRGLSPAEAETMLLPIIEALKYVHKQGLVHAHLRPSNVMAANEQLKISGDGLRPAGEIKGPFQTSIYDAPELKTGKISPAADVWSLAATLTEALTPRSTRQNGAYNGLPQPFSEIVQHCLRDDPAARWTLTDIEAHLQAKASEQHPVVREVSTPEIQPGMRRFLPFALAAVLLLIIAAIYGLVHNSKPAQSGPAQKPDVNASAASNSSPAKSLAGESSSGAVLQQVSPNASKNALRTIQGHLKVRVKVGVDASGNVTTENLTTPGPSKYFARLAMQAAQQWKFTPPKDNGQPIPSQWTILFEYTRGGISQQATLASH